MEFITIKIFDNPVEARIMMAKLESENIMCFLYDENIIELNPLYNITVGGIKLKIDKIDSEKAFRIVQEYENSPLLNEKGKIATCQNCKSEEIYIGFKSMRGLKGTLVAILSLFLIVFPIYYKTVNKCKKCGYEFQEH